MHEIPATWRSVLADRIKSDCLASHRAGWEKDFEGVSVRRCPKVGLELTRFGGRFVT